jgi:hypothetical protein
MSGTNVARWLVLGLAAMSLVGCRVKSVESFESAVKQSPNSPGGGDPYTYGGMAEGTGGLSTKTSYPTDNKSDDPLAVTASGKAGRIDQPRLPVSGGAPGGPVDKTQTTLGEGAKVDANGTQPVGHP